MTVTDPDLDPAELHPLTPHQQQVIGGTHPPTQTGGPYHPDWLAQTPTPPDETPEPAENDEPEEDLDEPEPEDPPASSTAQGRAKTRTRS